MDEFAEWGEGTTGFIAADSSSAEGVDLDGACGEQLWRHNHRDVVVCLVDCNEGMFAALPAVDSVTAAHHSNKAASVQVSYDYATCGRQSTIGRKAGVDGGAAGGSGTAAHSPSSSFSIAMQSILALLKEKLMCRSKDIFSIVLYNTRVSTSSNGFRGVYVVQEATHIGLTCIQKVEHLEAAGVPGSTAYEEFRNRIGCLSTRSVCPVFTASPESGSGNARINISASSVLTPVSAFGEALWEAQRIFLGIRGYPGVHRRRIFVFTNCDDPSGGDAREWNVCRSRACDLSKEGVVLEVFGFGKVGGAGMSHPSSSSSSAFAGRSVDADDSGRLTPSTAPVVMSSTCRDDGSSGSSLFSILDAPDRSIDPTPGSTAAVGAGLSGSRYSKSSPAAAMGFVQDFFWAPLLMQMRAASTRSEASADTNDAAALAEARAESLISDSEGAVYVSAGSAMLQQLLISVMSRGNMQMPFRYCELRIGGLCGATSSLPDRPTVEKSIDGAFRAAAVPRMAVSVYIPFMRAHPLHRQWIDKRTNQVLRRVVHLHATAAATHGSDDSAVAEDQEEVDGSCTGQPRRGRHEADTTKDSQRWREDVEVNDLHYYAQVAQERVYLTAEERKKIVEVAAAGSEPGFTVLLFKDISDALRAKKKVAIAQYCSSVNRAPRLVALVPSPDLTLNSEKRSQVPVDGLGLYVVPLPYAEELRTVPGLTTCKVDSTHKSPVLEDTTVNTTHLELARQIVSALTVSYRIDAVFNPALRLQFCKLQELLRRRLPSASCLLYPEVGTALMTTEEEAGRRSADGATQELDNTLPDYEGMKSYAALFQSFNTEVLGNDYNASFYCPKLRTAESTARRPREGAAGTMASEGWSAAAAGESTTHVSIEELIRQVATENAWDCVTVLQLKNYLTAMHVSTGGARRKADLVERVKQHLPPSE